MPTPARSHGAAAAEVLIELTQCGVRFATAAGEHWGLEPLTFTLRRGERWVVTGANGAGKSIFLKLLRGDMWPTPIGTEARRYHFNQRWQAEPAGIKQHLGLIAPERQDKYVRYSWNLSVAAVVTTGLFDEDIPLTRATPAQQRQVARVLKQFRLWSLRARRMLELSYGQRRRVLLARLAIAQPEVWLLDEVFNGLDAPTQQQLREWLDDARRASTWLLATHSAADIPHSATHLLHLHQGRVRYAGPIHAAATAAIDRAAAARHAQATRWARHRALPAPRVAAAPVQQPLITLKNVALFRHYRPVLRAVNWSIQPGEQWAIMGANGSGKSTLLLLLYGNLHPAHGGVIERYGAPPGTPIAAWKQRVGYLSPELQAEHIWLQTVDELVASGRYASVGLNQPLTAADRRAATPWLDYFNITALRQRTLRQISYGQLRLALFARALIQRPTLLLLDEPFTGLDPELQARLRAVVQRLTEQGTQVVMAIHDPADALPAINKVLMLGADGRVTARAWR